MKKLFTLFCFIIFNSLLANPNTDSLENKLVNSKGTEKVDVLNKLSVLFLDKSIDKSFEYSRQALELAQNYSYKKGEADALFNISKGYYNKNQNDTALIVLKNALELFLENNDSIQMSSAFNYIGSIYNDYSNYEKALEYYFRSLKVAEKLKNTKQIAYTLTNIGNTYFYQLNYPLALKYYTDAFNASKKLNDKKFRGIILNNLGAVYSNLGNDKKAIESYTNALNHYTEIGWNKGVGQTYDNIGIIYKNEGKRDSALYYFNQSYEIAEDNANIYSMANISLNIADLYLDPLNFEKADLYLSNALKYAGTIGANDIIRLTYENYAKLFSGINNFEKAFYYQSLYLQMHDSIFNEESNKRIADMQIKYEVEKKEREIILLNTEKELQETKISQQRNFNLFLTIFASIVLLASVVFYFQKSAQKKANLELVKRNLELVKSENELANIKSKREDIAQGKNYLKTEFVDEKYKSSTIDEKQMEDLKNQILISMTEQKLFKDKDLNINSYSEKIGAGKNHVSQVINQKFNKNFNNFINEFRVKEARRMLSDSKYQNITIEAIADEVGFASKSSFYRVFKDITGITPSFYLKSAKAI